MSHLTYTVLFALLLAGVMGWKRPAYAAFVFLSGVLTVVAGSWIMFLIHA